HGIAAGGGAVDAVAVEEDAQRLREADPPVLVVHGRAVGPEPAHVGHVAAVDGPPLEPAAAAEHAVAAPHVDQAARVLEEVLVRALPVEPRDLVVLAV